MSDLSSKYEILRVLGAGGMAEVSLARAHGPSDFAKRVVIKRILPHLANNAEFVALFEREARLSAMIDHPNVVQIIDFGRDQGRPYLVMEFVDGGSLRDVNAGLRSRDERADFRLMAKVFSMAAEGLACAHAAVDPRTKQALNVVHRDVSPDNLLLSRSGAVKISDFGVARAMVEISTTAPDIVRGKIAYLSPEQLLGHDVTGAADQWSLGVSMYEALVGQRPFGGNNEGATMYAITHRTFAPLRSVRSETPELIEQIIERCLALDPAKRWPDCHELAIALDRFVQASGGPITSSILGSWVDRVLVPTPTSSPPFPAKLLPEIPSGVVLPQNLASRFGAEPVAAQPPVAPRQPVAPVATTPAPAPAAVEASPPVRPAEPEPPDQATAPRSSWPVVLVAVALVSSLALGFGWSSLRAVLNPPSTLLVNAQPPGAIIMVDGLEVGTTLWAGDVSPDRPHEVTVALPGYTTWQLSLDAGVSTTLEVHLKRRR